MDYPEKTSLGSEKCQRSPGSWNFTTKKFSHTFWTHLLHRCNNLVALFQCWFVCDVLPMERLQKSYQFSSWSVGFSLLVHPGKSGEAKRTVWTTRGCLQHLSGPINLSQLPGLEMYGQLSTDCSAAVVVPVTVLALMNFPLFSPTRYSRFSRIPLAYRRQWFVLLHQVFHLAIFQNYYRKMSLPP